MSGKTISIFALLTALFWVGSVVEPTPEATYRFPLDYSEPALSGTFGELRSNHFHSGIDVKTGGSTGHKLYAIADGYIYRLKVSPWGFGKAVYLRHPDGKFSVYAHMKGFPEEIESFIYQKQYASKHYEQEIYLSKNRFPIKKGQLIGYSGNSGSSSGPHLHFEIRDPDERILNPQKHYSTRIKDSKPPILQTIGFEAMDAGSRAGGTFGKQEFTPEGGEGNYRIPGIVQVSGRVGMEYHGYDLLNAAGNHCGINYAKLFIDNELIYEFALDRFAFDEKKYINVHFDYRHWKNKSQKFQKCYVESGNEFSAYKNMRNRGVIDLPDNGVHSVLLEVSDTYGNTTSLKTRMQKVPLPGLGNPNLPASSNASISTYIKRKTLVAVVSKPAAKHKEGLDIKFKDGTTERIKPAYYKGNKLYFLYTLTPEKVPMSIWDIGKTVSTQLKLEQAILPFKNNLLDFGEAQVYFPYKCTFDTLFMKMERASSPSRAYSDVYKVGTTRDPLFKSFVISIKPTKKGNLKYMTIAKKNRRGVWAFQGNDIREDGSIFASSGTFGEFCVMADSIAPTLNPKNFKDGKTIPKSQNSLSARLSDNFSGIDDTRIVMTLDDEWILGEFDGKRSTVTHYFKERPASGKHILELMVYDNADNLKTERYTLTF